MAGSLKMACHRTSHDSKANEANIDHSDLSFHDLLCVDHLVRVPPKAFDGGRLRLVFAADPAAISDLVEMSKQEGIVDLPGAGFVAAGIVGQLHMGNAPKVLSQRWRDITLHHLHVIDVVLNEQIVRSDIRDDLNGLLRSVQEEAGNV